MTHLIEVTQAFCIREYNGRHIKSEQIFKPGMHVIDKNTFDNDYFQKCLQSNYLKVINQPESITNTNSTAKVEEVVKPALLDAVKTDLLEDVDSALLEDVDSALPEPDLLEAVKPDLSKVKQTTRTRTKKSSSN